MNPFMFNVSNMNPDEEYKIVENEGFKEDELKLKILEVIEDNIIKYPKILSLNKDFINDYINKLKKTKDMCISNLETRIVYIYSEDLLNARMKPHWESPTVCKIKSEKHVKLLSSNVENGYSLIYVDKRICFVPHKFLKTIDEVYSDKKSKTIHITSEESKILLDKIFKSIECR